jgi:NADH:ubiquinone oxidoreductase subunit E
MTIRAELRVCMGSACHQHGVYNLLPRVQRFLEEHGLVERVALKGAFCLDLCQDAVVVQLTTLDGEVRRERLIRRVSDENLERKLSEELLPYVGAAAPIDYTD